MIFRLGCNFGGHGESHDSAVHYLVHYILFSIIQQCNESKQLYPQTITFSVFLSYLYIFALLGLYSYLFYTFLQYWSM